MTADDDTGELRLEQAKREREERDAVRDADLPAEARAHARRADKAAYLRDKLAERAESEERVEDEA